MGCESVFIVSAGEPGSVRLPWANESNNIVVERSFSGVNTGTRWYAARNWRNRPLNPLSYSRGTRISKSVLPLDPMRTFPPTIVAMCRPATTTGMTN
jgi:hypothetical protein